VTEFSDKIREEIGEMTRRCKVGFLDPTDTLREAARQHAIHGPGDWKHFNEAGYRILGRAIADYLHANPAG
jgi:hypothetical protein